MYQPAQKKTSHKNSVSNSIAKQQKNNGSILKDNRASSIVQQKQVDAIHNTQPIQKKKNNTGLPDALKSGMESLSGHSMDDVKVHYNSPKPAQLNAHAYAQGTNIHLASGQEKHLPHEAWHVVQQKQGRVQPTKTVAGAKINDNASLEKEADVMGAKALQRREKTMLTKKQNNYQLKSIIQRNGDEEESTVPVKKESTQKTTEPQKETSTELAIVSKKQEDELNRKKAAIFTFFSLLMLQFYQTYKYANQAKQEVNKFKMLQDVSGGPKKTHYGKAMATGFDPSPFPFPRAIAPLRNMWHSGHVIYFMLSNKSLQGLITSTGMDKTHAKEFLQPFVQIRNKWTRLTVPYGIGMTASSKMMPYLFKGYFSPKVALGFTLGNIMLAANEGGLQMQSAENKSKQVYNQFMIQVRKQNKISFMRHSKIAIGLGLPLFGAHKYYQHHKEKK